MILPDPPQELETRRARHIEVADYDIECLCGEHRKRLRAAETDSHRGRFSHGFAQSMRKGCHKVSIIVNEQDIQCAQVYFRPSNFALCCRIIFTISLTTQPSENMRVFEELCGNVDVNLKLPGDIPCLARSECIRVVQDLFQ